MKHLPILTLFLLLFSICCFLSCDKKPTDPDPEDGEHLFYISAAYGADSSIVKIFSVEQLKFIDSLIIDDFRVGDMAVIGNNEMLIVSEGYRTRVYDLETKDMIHSADGYGYPLQISPNSEYYQAFDDRLQIRKTEDFQLIYSDTEPSGEGDFSFDSKYYVYPRDPGDIMIYNIQGDSIETSFGLTRNGSPFNVIKLYPSSDMSKLFLVGYQGWSLYFAVTDLGGDTVRILQAPLKTWGEDAIVSPDGKCLYFVNTPYADHEMPSMKVDVYDVGTEELITSISTNDYLFEPKWIVLTSDGKYLMATPWGFGAPEVLLINSTTMTIMGSYGVGDQRFPSAICTKR